MTDELSKCRDEDYVDHMGREWIISHIHKMVDLCEDLDPVTLVDLECAVYDIYLRRKRT